MENERSLIIFYFYILIISSLFLSFTLLFIGTHYFIFIFMYSMLHGKKSPLYDLDDVLMIIYDRYPYLALSVRVPSIIYIYILYESESMLLRNHQLNIKIKKKKPILFHF